MQVNTSCENRNLLLKCIWMRIAGYIERRARLRDVNKRWWFLIVSSCAKAINGQFPDPINLFTFLFLISIFQRFFNHIFGFRLENYRWWRRINGRAGNRFSPGSIEHKQIISFVERLHAILIREIKISSEWIAPEVMIYPRVLKMIQLITIENCISLTENTSLNAICIINEYISSAFAKNSSRWITSQWQM